MAGVQRKTGKAPEVASPSAGDTTPKGSGGVVSGPTPAPASAMAPSRSARRPDEVAPARAGATSPPAEIAAFTCHGAMPGLSPATTAAMPATCGAAIEVPDL